MRERERWNSRSSRWTSFSPDVETEQSRWRSFLRPWRKKRFESRKARFEAEESEERATSWGSRREDGGGSKGARTIGSSEKMKPCERWGGEVDRSSSSVFRAMRRSAVRAEGRRFSLEGGGVRPPRKEEGERAEKGEGEFGWSSGSFRESRVESEADLRRVEERAECERREGVELAAGRSSPSARKNLPKTKPKACIALEELCLEETGVR